MCSAILSPAFNKDNNEISNREKMSSPKVRLCLFHILAYLCARTFCLHISVSLNPSQKKCFSEKLTSDTLFVASFTSSGDISVAIADEQSTIFTDKEKNVIHTAFTTKQYGTHTSCIENVAKRDVVVWMELKWGPEARDYSQVAKKEHLDDLVLRIRHLQDELRQYHSTLLYMRSRESRMRETIDSTSFRVSVFCIFVIVVVLLNGILQATYFRNFFKSKKII